MTLESAWKTVWGAMAPLHLDQAVAGRSPIAPLATEEPKVESPKLHPQAMAGTGAETRTIPPGEQAPEDQ